MKKLELSSFISKIALILLVLTTVVFTSCENFLQGEDVKEEISKAIEYNNAATYVLHLVALKGSGDIKTPAGEEISKKVSDTFNVKFVPEDNHKFIKWEAVISGLGQNEKVSDYIEFEDEKPLVFVAPIPSLFGNAHNYFRQSIAIDIAIIIMIHRMMQPPIRQRVATVGDMQNGGSRITPINEHHAPKIRAANIHGVSGA